MPTSPRLLCDDRPALTGRCGHRPLQIRYEKGTAEAVPFGYVIGKFKYSPKGKSPHSLSISFSFPFQNFKPIFSHYNYSSMELNGTGFSQAFPFNFHFIPQTIPRIFPYSSHSFPLIFPGSSLTIFSFSFLALFSFLSRQLGTLTSLYEIKREPFHFHFFLQTFLLGIRRG